MCQRWRPRLFGQGHILVTQGYGVRCTHMTAWGAAAAIVDWGSAELRIVAADRADSDTAQVGPGGTGLELAGLPRDTSNFGIGQVAAAPVEERNSDMAVAGIEAVLELAILQEVVDNMEVVLLIATVDSPKTDFQAAVGPMLGCQAVRSLDTGQQVVPPVEAANRRAAETADSYLPSFGGD